MCVVVFSLLDAGLLQEAPSSSSHSNTLWDSSDLIFRVRICTCVCVFVCV